MYCIVTGVTSDVSVPSTYRVLLIFSSLAARKLSKWQLPVQPVMKSSSKWHFPFSVLQNIHFDQTLSVKDVLFVSGFARAHACRSQSQQPERPRCHTAGGRHQWVESLGVVKELAQNCRASHDILCVHSNSCHRIAINVFHIPQIQNTQTQLIWKYLESYCVYIVFTDCCPKILATVYWNRVFPVVSMNAINRRILWGAYSKHYIDGLVLTHCIYVFLALTHRYIIETKINFGFSVLIMIGIYWESDVASW